MAQKVIVHDVNSLDEYCRKHQQKQFFYIHMYVTAFKPMKASFLSESGPCRSGQICSLFGHFSLFLLNTEQTAIINPRVINAPAGVIKRSVGTYPEGII